MLHSYIWMPCRRIFHRKVVMYDWIYYVFTLHFIPVQRHLWKLSSTELGIAYFKILTKSLAIYKRKQCMKKKCNGKAIDNAQRLCCESLTNVECPAVVSLCNSEENTSLPALPYSNNEMGVIYILWLSTFYFYGNFFFRKENVFLFVVYSIMSRVAQSV
jgi:hypothetical protein